VRAYLARPFIAEVMKRDVQTINKNWQGYPTNPVPALLQLHRLQRQVSRRLARIKQPLLIVQGRLDRAIDLKGIDLLYDRSGAEFKQLHWMERSGHVVILEDELEQVAKLTLRFIEQVMEKRINLSANSRRVYE
jgi:carboxylesterase